MAIGTFRLQDDGGLTLIKIRYQREPNELYGKGLGINVLGYGIALYWNPRSKGVA